MRVLVVDDEEKYAGLVAAHLTDAGHEVNALFSGTAAVKSLRESSYDVVVTDLKMAPVNGLEVLKAAKSLSPETEVVLMTAHGDVETAVAAMRQGAYDFITKPFPLDELVLILERISEKRTLKQENRALREELASDRFADMVGDSPPLARVRSLVAKVAVTDASVLILGESGVGKELVARLVHRSSPRAARPFVVVHAAALPETLLESELFGYEKGAFTGAAGRKLGRLETADGGSIFLDEIGEISPALQVKLLRFLQERTFVRLGGSQTLHVDARIIAATNRDLLEEVRTGRFREDLYYRLAVFPIQVPALRERKSDLAPLTHRILTRLGYQHLTDDRGAAPVIARPGPGNLDGGSGQAPLGLEVMALLESYDWPGNVRELENVIERAMILAGGEPIQPRHIQLPEPVLVQPEAGARGSLFDVERQMLEAALQKAGGNKSRAAKLLGITRRMLYTKLQKFGISYEEETDS